LYLRNNEPIITKKKKKREKIRPRERIFTQPSKYFSILKILQYDYDLLSLYTLLLYESLHSTEPGDYYDSLDGPPEQRTIVNSSIKHDDPLILLSEEILSFDGSLKDK